MGWIQNFGWGDWKDGAEAERFRTDPETFTQATPEQLSQVLTCLIRGDRFCEGNLSSAYEAGLLVPILRRAAALAEIPPRDQGGA